MAGRASVPPRGPPGRPAPAGRPRAVSSRVRPGSRHSLRSRSHFPPRQAGNTDRPQTPAGRARPLGLVVRHVFFWLQSCTLTGPSHPLQMTTHTCAHGERPPAAAARCGVRETPPTHTRATPPACLQNERTSGHAPQFSGFFLQSSLCNKKMEQKTKQRLRMGILLFDFDSSWQSLVRSENLVILGRHSEAHRGRILRENPKVSM